MFRNFFSNFLPKKRKGVYIYDLSQKNFLQIFHGKNTNYISFKNKIPELFRNGKNVWVKCTGNVSIELHINLQWKILKDKNKNMTLKEIKKHYNVYKIDGKYHLHSLEVGNSRQVHKYICTITKNGRYFRLMDKIPTPKIEVLLEQIGEYLKNLEYDSEYYCPTYRKGFAQECFVIDRLMDYGFSNPTWMADYYKLNRDSIYGYSCTDIKLTHSINENYETVKLHLSTSKFSWVTVTCGFDFKEIHRMIDGLLKPLLLSEGIQNIKLSEKMRNSNVNLIIEQLQGFNINSSKIELKEKLLEIAKNL